MTHISDHFVERVKERIGEHVDPLELGRLLFDAIDQGRDDYVQFVMRLDRNGRRLFKFRCPKERLFYAILNTKTRAAITVLMPQGMAKSYGGRKVWLEDEYDLPR
jgi:hypothetical protein